MVRDFCLSEVDLAAHEPPSSPAKAKALVDEQRTRHLAWLHRGQVVLEKGARAPWRPIELHRKGAEKWAYCQDNVLRVMTPHPGLIYFVYDAKKPEWQDWRLWPTVVLPQDKGPESEAGTSALQLHYDCNCWKIEDLGHGAARTFDATLKDSGCKPLWLLGLVTLNLPWSWDNEEIRLAELKDTMRNCFEVHTAQSCTLFQDVVDDIIQEHREAGIFYEGELEPEAECFEFVKKRCAFSKTGRRATMGRFLSSIDCHEEAMPHWSTDRFATTYMAIEKDMLRGSAVMSAIKVTGGIADETPEGGGTLSHSAPGVVRSAFSGSGINAVIIAVLFRSNAMHKFIVRAVCTLGGPTRRWVGTSWVEGRCADGCHTWFLGQQNGAFVANLEEILGQLENDAVLQSIGLDITFSDDAAHDNLEAEIAWQDEMADFAGQFALSHVRHRWRRDCWLFSWPHGISKILLSEEQKAQTIVEFQLDKRLNDEFKALPKKTAHEILVMKRSRFNHRAVKWIDVALAEVATNEPVMEEFKTKVKEKTTGMLSSMAVEESVAAAKSIRTTCGPKFKRQERAMAAILERGVVDKRSHYETAPVTLPRVPRSSRLAESAFKLDPQVASMDFSDISSTKQTPPWAWSPNAQSYTVPDADRFMLRAAAHDLHLVRKAWLGELLDAKHKLAVRITDGVTTSWKIAMHHFSGSSGVVWPARRCTVPGNTFAYLEILLEGRLPEPCCVFDIQDPRIMACTFDWRSPKWQFYNGGRSLSPAIRPIINSKEEVDTLAVVACRKAWWNLPNTTVRGFGKEIGAKIPSGASLCTTLFIVCKHVLKESDEQILRRIHHRFVSFDQCLQFWESLQCVDEACAVLDKDDQQRMEAAINHDKEMAESRAAFKKEYLHRWNDVREAKAAAEPAPKKKARKAPLPPPAPARVWTFAMSLEEAKALKPVGSFVWRGFTRGEWWGHLKPYPRYCASFAAFGGEDMALKHVLQRLWRQRLELDGFPDDACPVAGLF